MTLSLRSRILLTVSPLLVLLAAVGSVGLLLLVQLGHRSDAILRENYDSVQALNRLKLAVFANDWPEIELQFQIEKNNITIQPEEPQLVSELEFALERYRTNPEFRTDVLRLTDAIHDLNDNHMRQASRNAKRTAEQSIMIFLSGLCLVVIVAFIAVWWLQRTLLEPIRAITQAATQIGSGQLHQIVPVQTRDEVGQLGEAFNTMAAKLREYRQTDTERLLRARQTGQATIDSFADPVFVIDTFGRIELANPAAQRVLGVTPPRDNESRVPWVAPEPLQKPIAETLQTQRAVLTDSFDNAVTFVVNGEDSVYFPQIRPIRSESGEPLGAAVVLTMSPGSAYSTG